jgi:hypothetical protein
MAARRLPFFEKAKRLLVHLAAESKRYGEPLDLTSPRLDAMLQTLNHNDVGFVARFLVQQRWLEDMAGGQRRVSGDGFLKAEEWREASVASLQAFVAA